jgi:multimeric flavodoxin WrbA
MIKKWTIFGLKILPYLVPVGVTFNFSSTLVDGHLPFTELNNLITTSLVISLCGLIIERIFLKFISYLDFAVFVDICVIFVLYHLYPAGAKVLMYNFLVVMYFSMFFVSFVPQIFGFKPFTYLYTVASLPKSVLRMDKFIKIQVITSNFWAGIFLFSCILTALPLAPSMDVMQKTLPLVVMIFIGIPFSYYSRDYFNGILPNNTPFETALGALQALPHALNKKVDKTLHQVLQFDITGDETIQGYVEINKRKAHFYTGVHPSPDCIIHAPADVWVDVASNRIDGSVAYLEKKMTVDKDPSIIKKLEIYFHIKPKPKFKSKKTNMFSKYPYDSADSGSIKKVLVLDGGPRPAARSKTKMMINAFCEGLKNENAHIDVIDLNKSQIKSCVGCYSCRVKTPGVCIFNDDMTDIMKKYEEADLIILSTPLYYNTMSGPLKLCLDRLFPVLQLYKKDFTNGILYNAESRFKKPQGLVVFSAGGNNMSIEENFMGLSLTVRTFVQQYHYIQKLYGEFYLPAAERLSDPAFSDRVKIISNLLSDAGSKLVRNGSIDINDMVRISNQGVTEKEAAYFNQQHQEMFFKILERKNA